MDIMLIAILLVSFVVLVAWLKVPVGLSMALSAYILAAAAGHFFPLKFLVKGMFAYFDVCLVLMTAMVLMKVMERNGLLNTLTQDLIMKFGRSPLVLLSIITLIIMFPGAITGSCAASVLSTGILLAPVLLRLGMPRNLVAATITMASVYGMIAPPVNVVVMIIGGGMDVPYIGFDLVLLLITVPLAIASTLYFAYRYAAAADLDAIVKEYQGKETASGKAIYLPFLVVMILMIGPKVLPQMFIDLGLPLTFTVGTLLCLLVGTKFSLVQAARDGISEIMPIVGILIGVGMLIEIMTLTGVRGSIVVNTLSLPPYLMLLGMAVMMPLFGGISVYGAASVFGVPFALAMLGQNHIITISGLSLIASMGSFMPPVALTPVVAAQVMGESNYWRVIRPCIIPGILAVVVGVLIIIFADPIAGIIL